MPNVGPPRLARAACQGALLALVAACHTDRGVTPDVLRVSALPDQAPERVLAEHQGLVAEVCRIAKVTCTWVPAPSYDALVEQLGRGDIDIAFFGGATFAQAHARYGAVPLAMRDVDFAFSSVILVRTDDSARTLADLRGRPFAFGNRRSTSGHFMPRYYLEQLGIDPERTFASVTYTSGHDATMRLIADGKVAAGAVNASLAYAALASGDTAGRRLRVLWRSPPFTDYVWAGRKELSASLRQRLTDAFLDLDRAVPAQRIALDHEGAGGYVPAYVEEFEKIATILRERREL